MTPNPIVADLITLLNKIASLKKAGVNIVHEECPKELGWAFTNKDTGNRVGFVGINKLKVLIRLNKSKTDPRIKYLIGFAAGGHAIEARNAINKLENLKAFW